MALLCFIVICVHTLAQAEMNSMNMSMIIMNLGKLDDIHKVTPCPTFLTLF